MSSADSPENGAFSLSLARRIDPICDRFESHWKNGRQPRLEAYLAGVDPADQPTLLRELLILELEYRCRRGEQPLLANYLQRFAPHEELVEAVFREVCTEVRPAQPVLPPCEPSTAESMRMTIWVIAGPHLGQSFQLTGRTSYLVGRSHRTHFPLRGDQYLSRFQFMVELHPPHFRLMDLSSRSGTSVNGQKVKIVDLRDGDEIRCGRTVMRVAIEHAPPVAAVGEVVDSATVIDPPA